MSAMTAFYQKCPVCGRNLRVPVKYFGRPMSCSHCAGEFIAGQDAAQPPPPLEARMVPVSGLMVPAAFGQPHLGEV